MMLPITRCYGLWTRARCAVAGAAQAAGGQEGKRRGLIHEAKGIARQLGRMQTPCIAPQLGWSIEAAAAHLMSQSSVALERLEHAEATFAREGWMLHALSLMFRRGQLLGGEAGRELLAKATSELVSRGVRNPPQFVEVYVPGVRS